MTPRALRDPEERYWRFVELIVERGEVWVLVRQGSHGGAWIASREFVDENGEPVAVHLVFSTEARARRHRVRKWSHYVTATVELDAFVDRMLPQLARRAEFLGADFPKNLRGLEIEPEQLAADIASAAYFSG